MNQDNNNLLESQNNSVNSNLESTAGENLSSDSLASHNINSQGTYLPDQISDASSSVSRRGNYGRAGVRETSNGLPKYRRSQYQHRQDFGSSYMNNSDGALENETLDNNANDSTSYSSPSNNVSDNGLSETDKGAEKAVKVASRALVTLLSNPITWVLIGASILLFCIFVIFVVIFNSDGSLNKKSYACTTSVTTSMDMTKTNLSKQEFVEHVNNYVPTTSTSSEGQRITSNYEIIKQNAGLIYDMAAERGYNPEFAIIRADIEGYSPGGATNNFWGINCENGHPEKCDSKPDFASGLSRFFDVLDKYQRPKEEGGYGIDISNIYEVMNLYADLGSKWFSPGGPSLGGCYYLKDIKPYITEQRYNEIKASCDAKTEIPVSADDEIAYAKYQVETETIPHRQKIFNIGAEDVRVCSTKQININPSITPDNLPIMSSANINAGAYLQQNNSSIKVFNNTLLETVKKDGIGTRKAVVDAAMLLINTFSTYDIKLPYSYLGGWGHYDSSNPNDHNYVISSYYGLNPYFGEAIYEHGNFGHFEPKYNKTYYYLGLDCSGFVGWSLHNGGVKHSLVSATNYKNAEMMKDRDGAIIKSYPANSTTSYIGQPGDVLSSSKHVVLVLKYESESNSYIFAEAGGKEEGILIRKKKLSSLDNYSIVDMSDYYTEAHTNSNYVQDFQNKRFDKESVQR